MMRGKSELAGLLVKARYVCGMQDATLHARMSSWSRLGVQVNNMRSRGLCLDDPPPLPWSPPTHPSRESKMFCDATLGSAGESRKALIRLRRPNTVNQVGLVPPIAQPVNRLRIAICFGCCP